MLVAHHTPGHPRVRPTRRDSMLRLECPLHWPRQVRPPLVEVELPQEHIGCEAHTKITLQNKVLSGTGINSVCDRARAGLPSISHSQSKQKHIHSWTTETVLCDHHLSPHGSKSSSRRRDGSFLRILRNIEPFTRAPSLTNTPLVGLIRGSRKHFPRCFQSKHHQARGTDP